jgi:glyoxalase family protein
MPPVIHGLHHVTATVTDAQEDLDFYTGALAMRLVKKTVNFDNHHVYHFYYGNTQGQPSTIMTTFPYGAMGVPPGRHGAGQITATSFTVPADALPFWHDRLRDRAVAVTDERDAFGGEAIRFRDPSGLVLRLVAARSDSRAPWVGADVDASRAITGVHGVTLTVEDPAKTAALLTGLLGFEVAEESGQVTRLAVSGEAPGHLVELVRASDATPTAVNGLGTIHHVAFAIGTPDEQLAIRDELIGHGYQVTEVRDRQYFKSIYFREPNGVLFEVATIPPGFTVDEELATLGQGLKLPPWEEPNRADIETNLPAVRR